MVEFRLLGPMEMRVAGRAVELGPVKQRNVLAVLLVEAGHPVSLETLADRIWERTPAAARNTLYAHISRLRRVLAAASDDVRLARHTGGYVLEVARDRVDVFRFRRLLDEAQHPQCDDERRAALLREALALWRGAPLRDLPGAWAAGIRESWQQQRLAAAALWAQTETRLGRAAAVVPALSALLAEHPLVEPLVAELMRALYALGRGAEALDWHARIRQRLADEFGVEPGPELHELHVAILRGNLDAPQPAQPAPPAVPLRPPAAVPAQLPAYVADFTGRTGKLAQLDNLLADERARTVVISGTAGVGKTTLAVHWAQRVRERFGDGQLYVNLHGYASRAPVRPVEALAQFLRALGVPAQDVPIDVDEAGGLYRSLLADKRALVLLDNAASADQVRPLLPAAPGCLVLVTSRNRLGGLVARDGARRLTLDVLTPAEATALLTGVLGAARAETAADALAELAAACGYLPLALRIAAATLSDRPNQRLTDYLDALTAGDRLGALAISDDRQTGVRTAFDLSYQALSAEAKRLFCLLGTVPGADFTAEAAAALMGAPVARAGQVLDQLVTTHMVQESSPGRYTFHDLLRVYARQQAAGETSRDERRSAFRRLCAHYLLTIDRAARLLYPQMFRLPLPAGLEADAAVEFRDHQRALSWLDAERSNLVALLETAAEQGPRQFAWLIADSLRGYLGLRQYMLDWFAIAEAGLGAAAAERDPVGQAAAHHSLAQACHSLTWFPRAIEHLIDALRLSAEGGWSEGHTAALCNLGILYADLGRLDQAVEHYSQALADNRRAGSVAGTAVNLNNLGDVYRQMGELAKAMEHITAALALYKEINSPTGHASALTHLGGIYRDLGRLDVALDHVSRGLAMHREVGDRYGEASALAELSRIHHDAGRWTEAAAAADATIELSQRLGDQRLEAAAHNASGAVCAALGRRRDAHAHFEQARAIAAGVGAPHPETVAMIGLARLHHAANDVETAVEHATQALKVARNAGYRGLARDARAIVEA